MDDQNGEKTNCAQFLDLPHFDVIQDAILPRLSVRDLFRFRTVSKQCKMLVTDYWRRTRKLDLSLEYHDMRTKTLTLITENSVNISVLNLSRCSFISKKSIVTILKLNPRLKYINLSGNYVNKFVIDAITKSCNQVKTLELEFCGRLNGRHLKNLGDSCQELTSINVSFCPYVDDFGLIYLVQRCKCLTSISLSGCNITDVALIAISQYCNNLLFLDISWCFNITDGGIKAITAHCDQLKDLQSGWLCHNRASIYFHRSTEIHIPSFKCLQED